MSSILTRLALEDYLALPETNVPTEVVDGVLVVSAFANARHQRAARRLAMALTGACPPEFEVLGPIEWLLRTDPPLVRQPDLAVVTNTVADAALPRLTSPPLLVVEILSSDSLERDLVTKPREYFAAGLGHYWVVDPDDPTIVGFEVTGPYAQAHGDQPFAVEVPFPFRVTPRDLVA